MKSLLRIATITLLFTGIAAAQDTASVPPITPAPVQSVPEKKEIATGKVGLQVVNSEYTFNPFEAVEYLQGVKANLELKEAKFAGFYLNGVFIYKRNSFETPVDTYAFGQKLSRRFGPFEPYGQVALGFDTSYNHDRTFTREYSLGADINVGHIYFRPVEFSWKRTEGLFSPATQTVSGGLGARF